MSLDVEFMDGASSLRTPDTHRHTSSDVEEDSKTSSQSVMKDREKENKHPVSVPLISRHKQSFSMSTNHLNLKSGNSTNLMDEKPRNNDNHYDLDVIKQNELIQHLKELKQEYGTRIYDLDSTIQHLTRINDGYEDKIVVLQQQNEYLTDAAHQWKTRYDETNTMLIDAKQEILNLKTEVLNLQISYEQDIKQMHSNVADNFIAAEAAADKSERSASHSKQLRQYQRESLQLKRDNKTYLTQLQQMSDQCRQQRAKCEALSNIQNDLQNELNVARGRNTELNAMVREYFVEVTSLEQQNSMLKQTLNEIQQQTKDGLYDEDGNAVKISYAPDTSRSVKKWRTRSTSQFSTTSYNDSDGNSPVLGTNNVDKMDNDDIYAESVDDDMFVFPYDDDDDAKSDQLDIFYDLFQALNDYLQEMNECVEVMQRVQLLYRKHGKTGKRASRSHITTDFQTPEKSAGAPRTRLNSDDNKTPDGTPADRNSDDEYENMMKVMDVDEEHEALKQMNLVLHQSKECVLELHKQQKMVIDAERMRYHDLEVAHNHFKVQSTRKIKLLTKEMIYSTEYKKYGGYSQICWEMVENMGAYTKEAIIYKLTH
eukprot:CAMPEP_0202696042 /NCGR_PEP_ID=MMETSP1385-20130828/9422_1 /ASSEMBLY_ACC=CAM_ASM_000861 /TAXON_ID=933848 /ORGANISM="Elphidium margaritaceum" /LENGTH=595 /DNA_ID=CAMNT_0049352139 /DNA_START=41 /DNA_END=1828 /DNA_ORIENTATION=-